MIDSPEQMRALADRLEQIVRSSPVYFYTLPEYITLRKQFTLACREYEYCNVVKQKIAASHAMATPRCSRECGQCMGFGWVRRSTPLAESLPKWNESDEAYRKTKTNDSCK